MIIYSPRSNDLFCIFSVLGINSLNLIKCKLHVIFEFLHLAVHLINQTVSFLRTNIEESEVVFIGLYLLLELLIPTHQTTALIVKGIFTTFGNILQVALETIETATSRRNIQFLIQLVEYIVVFLIEFILLLIGNMTNLLVLLNEFLHLLLNIIGCILNKIFQLSNNTTLAFKIGTLFVTCPGIGCITSLKELVTS